MVLSFLKAVVLVAVGAIGAAAFIWGLMSRPAEPEALNMVALGLAAYLTAWVVGLYLSYK